MTVFEAIKTMRDLSEKRIAFGFTFMSYSRSKQVSQGIVEVKAARLKPRAKAATFQNAEIIEEYIDLHTGESRRFYQPALMLFNGRKIQLT